MWFKRVAFLFFITLSACDKSPRTMAKDSYIEAYKQVHESPKISKIQNSKISNRVSNQGSDQYGHPVPSYGPPPSPNYGVPQNNYGPPAPVYGAPAPIYGPPAPVYGPPMLPSQSEVFNGVGHALLGFFDKIHLKLDIATILKILLKLVIFKKIISFIGIICLLLFIPKFKMDKNEEEEEEEEMRLITSYSGPKSTESLNNLTKTVFEGIEKFSEKIDRKFTYERLFDMYSKEI